MLFGKKVVTVIKVEGLKCPHCKAKVETAIKAIDGVKKAVASLETNEVTITSKQALDKDVIITVVAEAGFTVL